VTLYATLGTLLATIPGMTLGTNVVSPENPRPTSVKALPGIEILRISDFPDYLLNCTRMCSQARVQLNIAASTAALLSALWNSEGTGTVNVKLDNNRVNFILAKPNGLMREGHDNTPSAFWMIADWLILY
jgi:hypothetical protein